LHSTPFGGDRAFSSEVDTGSREENASKQETRAPFRFHRNGKGSSGDVRSIGVYGRMPGNQAMPRKRACVELTWPVGRGQSAPMTTSVDPITRSVVQHRLSGIVAEMGEAMLRTSYSQILNSSRDFSLAICDTQSRLIAQADHIPVHVGALPWAARAVEARFSEVAPGDVILMNDPYHGGSHLPDLTVFVPIFDQGRRLFWTIVRAHQSDIGGATHGAYNPEATEIWQEGLRIPPIKLCDGGRLRDDILDMLALNVRNSHDFRGDLFAMIGAAHLGERRMQKLFAELSAPVVVAAIEGILDAAESQARSVIASWKDGTLYGASFVKKFRQCNACLPSSVSLFDLNARFFVPTRSRARAVARRGCQGWPAHQPFDMLRSCEAIP
jgi:hypothetical protein